MDVKFKVRLTIQIIIMLLMSWGMNANDLPKQNPEELHQQALDQADEIDLIVELLAVAANKGKFNQTNKNDSLLKFGKIRNVIHTIKESASDNLPKILGTNEVIIGSLEFMTGNHFKIIPNITSNMIVKRSSRNLSRKEAHEKLKINEKKLKNIQKSFKLIGLSTINIVTRKFEKIIKTLKIHKASPRLAPYALIFLYIIYVTRKTEIMAITAYLPWPLKTAIDSIKGFIGTAPYIKQDSSEAPEVHDRDQFEEGKVSKVESLLQTGNFLKIEVEPFVKWAPAAFLFGLIKKDPEELFAFVKKKINFVYAKLKNKSIENSTVFTKPLFNPDSLDLLEISEFKNLKNYFKYKNLFDLADHAVSKSYLFVGQQTTGYYMADILCAQLTKELNYDCRIVELNASDFVPPKKLKKSAFDKEDKLPGVLSDAKKHDICVVVIKDIDWIYRQKERSVAKLDKFLDDIAAKSNIVVIALTDKIDAVGNSAKDKLIKFDIDNLNYEQRLKFIKAQLRPDHVFQDMDIETIAEQTENYTLADLKKIVQDAYTISYAEHKPFNKRHLAQSAAKMARAHK